ncbi:MAG: hypothetical protein EXX96DRAFT_540101 [Benjaminiella poitrasii]|nr:MAG: hypothetical protein EXX96DRAFT_540101 [Benjaminiella poitrasii]
MLTKYRCTGETMEQLACRLRLELNVPLRSYSSCGLRNNAEERKHEASVKRLKAMRKPSSLPKLAMKSKKPHALSSCSCAWKMTKAQVQMPAVIIRSKTVINDYQAILCVLFELVALYKTCTYRKEIGSLIYRFISGRTRASTIKASRKRS